jgi:uncharacterized membrane protein
MGKEFWLRLHGGSTHFPIVLLFVSVLFDALGLYWPDRSARRGLHIAGFGAAFIAVSFTFVAIVSGLLISNWRTLGSGSLLRHHIFVWPVFGISIALVVWRLIMRERASSRAFGIYLLGMVAASALVFAAGYFGGELALAGQAGQ